MFNGSRLKILREASGQTQEELANALGVAHQQIWRWESGKNDPAGAMIARMAQIYKVSSDYLLNLIDDTNPNNGDFTPFEVELIASLRRGRLSRVFSLLTEWAGDVKFVSAKSRNREDVPEISKRIVMAYSARPKTSSHESKKTFEDTETSKENT